MRYLFGFIFLTIILSGCPECEGARACTEDGECPPSEYCDEFVCAPRCGSQSVGDGSEGAGCQTDKQCDSDVCDNNASTASCTCVGDGAGGSGGSGGGGGSGGSACGADTACVPGEAGAATCNDHCENDVCGKPTNTSVFACLDSGTCYCMCSTGACSDGTPACVAPIKCDPESTSDSCRTFFCDDEVCVGMIGDVPVRTVMATCAGEPGNAYCECLCNNGRETCDPPQ